MYVFPGDLSRILLGPVAKINLLQGTKILSARINLYASFSGTVFAIKIGTHPEVISHNISVPKADQWPRVKVLETVL